MEGFASGVLTALGWVGSGLAWFATTFAASAITFAEKLSFGIAAFIGLNFLRHGMRLKWSSLAVKGTLATLAIMSINGLFAPLVITVARAFQHAC